MSQLNQSFNYTQTRCSSKTKQAQKTDLNRSLKYNRQTLGNLSPNNILNDSINILKQGTPTKKGNDAAPTAHQSEGKGNGRRSKGNRITSKGNGVRGMGIPVRGTVT